MSWLITIKRVPGRREIIRAANRRKMVGQFSYWRFGKQWAIRVMDDGRIFDSRPSLRQRFQRWVDRKERNELFEALNARLDGKEGKTT